MNDSVRLGITAGAAIALVGHFATRGSASADLRILFFWFLIGGGVGLLVALAHLRTKRAEDARRESVRGSYRTHTGEVRPITGTTPKFYAISRTPSSSEMRALMVDAPTIPGNPISSRLQLIVERYDSFARVPMDAGSLLDYPVWDIRARALEEATARAPAGGASSPPVSFSMTYLRSEGPLDERGRSPFGWTFKFADGRLGIGCSVTVTAAELLVAYQTAVSYPVMEETAWVSPAKALEAVRQAFPALAEHPLWVRVNFPSDYHVFSRAPLALFPIGPEGALLGSEHLPPWPEGPGRETLTTAALLASLRAEAPDELATALLEKSEDALRATARRVFRGEGPSCIDALRLAVQQLAQPAAQSPGDADTPPRGEAPSGERPSAAVPRIGAQREALALTEILARIPADLTFLALAELADTCDAPVGTLAESLFDRRRRYEMGIYPDPVEELDFEESRALLGRVDCRRVALRSTYDPEGELLPTLSAVGLRSVRRRRLSGDTEIFLSAYLVTPSRQSEALLASSPLPVPCHILRIVGPESKALAELVRASGIHYGEGAILDDVRSGSATDVHRGALYMAAMCMRNPEAFEPLRDAYERYLTNPELRRACLAALAQLDHSGVVALLDAVDDEKMRPMARELRFRRTGRRKTGEIEAVTPSTTRPN